MYAVFRIGHFPSESDSETMLKVLKWGVVPLNLKGHGMTPHSLCCARINSPQFIHRFNHMHNEVVGDKMRVVDESLSLPSARRACETVGFRRHTYPCDSSCMLQE